MGDGDVRSLKVDFVIGGGSLRLGREQLGAKVLDWFARSLVSGLKSDGVVVGVESMGKDEASVYQMIDGVIVVG